MERLAHNHSEDTSELLSAYVDNEVDVVERRRAEEWVQRCTGCAQEVRELHMFKELLHEMPLVQPPRSFTLDPHTAPRPRWLLFPTFRFATVIATVLLFVVLGADMLGVGNSGAAAGNATRATSADAQDRAFSTLRMPESEAGSDTGGGAAASTGAAAAAVPPQQDAQLESAAASTAASAAASTAASEAVPEASAEASAAASAPAPEAAQGAETTSAAASAAPTAEPDAAIAEASTGAEMGAAAPAGGTAPQLQANQPMSPDTVSAKDAEDSVQPSRVDTLLIVEIALAVLAASFGVAALWAWRRGA